MIHVDAMLDSLSRSMSRSGFMSTFNTSKTSTATLPATASATNISSNPTLTDQPMINPDPPHVHSSTGSSLSRSSNGSHGKAFLAQVSFLDDTRHVFDIDKKAKGSSLLDIVFNHLEIGERDYFGLVFNDTGGPMPQGHAPDVMRWLDPQKLVRKQVRSAVNASNNKSENSQNGGANVTLFFRVKFYVTDPARLHEEYTRYLMYLQVKRDLCEGRLTAPISTISLLTSYAVQSTIGDYDQDTCQKGYLVPFRELRKQSVAAAGSTSNLAPEEMDRRIAELHKLHKHQSPAEAEFNFLEHAKRLEMYGISLHPGKDSNGRDIHLGVTCIGLVVFQNQVKINTFSWSKIVKISFKRKQFFIQLRKEVSESYDTLLGFNLASYRSCKNLWKSAVEHHSFFRLHSPKVVPRRFMLNLGSKFRYSGRTEFQTSHVGGAEKSRFSRSPGRKTLPLNLSTAAAAASAPVLAGPPRLASPETSSIGSSVHSNGGLKPVLPKPSAPPLIPTRGQDGSSRTSQESTTPTSLAHRAIESFSNKVQSLSTKLPKKAWQEDATSDDEGGFLDANRRISSLGRLSKGSSTQLTASTTSTSTNAQKSAAFTPANIPSARLPFADESSASDRASSVEAGSSTSGTIRSNSSVIAVQTPTNSSPKPVLNPVPNLALLTINNGSKKMFMKPATPPKLHLTSLKATTTTTLNGRCRNDDADGALIATPSSAAAAVVTSSATATASDASGELVSITIVPDEQSRFGFNVKGGVDQKLPIIVSRVGANTPADRCYPKLNEGDQIVMINGRDVSQHTHDQVVNFIRACSEPHSGHLILVVRQNVYLGEEVEEPEFQYVPETPHISPMVPGTQALAQSMLLLEESLDSGAILGQFEQLYRRNTNLAMSICHLPENLAKNRYRDISPYDITRVLLTACPSGDYINANHVDMTIPGSGIINRYIATQGPLAGTCVDFWYMIWEGQSSLIIMLTTIVERGRIKCHNYWPEVGETIEYGRLAVTCTKEDSRENFVFRDFSIRHLDKVKKRQVSGDGEPEAEVDDNDDVDVEDDQEVRHVTQMAYLSWPDHGVPENPDEFIQFVETVRLHRQGSICPTIVHCSAGIGRTGVLILMETALYLVEANQPVYPLELTRIMRDQRASMIQTPSQYKFVCQAILKVFKEGKVKPLPEFCHPT